MSSSGQMTLSFDPPIEFPAYMLASSSENSNSRNLSHQNLKEWAERKDVIWAARLGMAKDRIKQDLNLK